MTWPILLLMCVQIIGTLMLGWSGAVMLLGLIRRRLPRGDSDPKNRFAVIVCARNEEKVLSHLLKSLEEQDYPADAWHVYLLADHCTDGTVHLADRYPFVTVYERTDGPESGKGFDADNIAKSDFMSRMNEHLNKGNQLVQGNRLGGEPYRTFITKWYAAYWATYTIFYSYPREKLNLSCFLMISRISQSTSSPHYGPVETTA